MELEALVSAFEACSLSKADWTHHAHLRVGVWHVERFGSDEAIRRLRAGIRRLNDAHGTPNSETRGYHETITVVYCRLIAQFLATLPLNLPVEVAAGRVIDSPLSAPRFLMAYYSEPRLMSVQARSEWTEPDLGPLRLFHVSSAAGRRRSPWKNGCGWTSEIAISPQDASLDSFDWRMSIAGTESDAAFSLFPDVDRTLAVLSGEITLSVAGRPPADLNSNSLPVSFPGDVETVARIRSGPLVDFNVMTRRGRFTHQVTRKIVEDQTTIQLSSGVHAILCPLGGTAVSFASKTETLAAGDVAWFDGWSGTVVLRRRQCGAVLVAVVKRYSVTAP